MKGKIIKEKISDLKRIHDELVSSSIDMDKYKIDFLLESDIELACNLEKKCHELEPTSGVSFEGDSGFEELLRVYKKMQKSKEVLVLKNDKKYLGHIGFHISEDDREVGFIDFLSIDPTEQSKKLSFPLIMASIEILEEKKCKFIQASTSNFKLIKLTEQLNINHRETTNYKYNNL